MLQGVIKQVGADVMAVGCSRRYILSLIVTQRFPRDGVQND